MIVSSKQMKYNMRVWKPRKPAVMFWVRYFSNRHAINILLTTNFLFKSVNSLLSTSNQNQWSRFFFSFCWTNNLNCPKSTCTQSQKKVSILSYFWSGFGRTLLLSLSATFVVAHFEVNTSNSFSSPRLKRLSLWMAKSSTKSNCRKVSIPGMHL